MKLVDDAKNAWRWFSMRMFAVLTVVPVAWVSLPSDIKEKIPDSWDKWVFMFMAAVAVLGGAGRMVKQDIEPK